MPNPRIMIQPPISKGAAALAAARGLLPQDLTAVDAERLMRETEAVVMAVMADIVQAVVSHFEPDSRIANERVTRPGLN